MARAPLRSFFDCCSAILFLMFVCGEGGVVFLFFGGGGWVCGVFVLIL